MRDAAPEPDAHLIEGEASAQQSVTDSDMLFLLSHMRSFSTLLVHILASSPQLTGNRELHRSYHSVDEVHSIARQVTGEGSSATAMDNILHNHHQLGDEVLASNQCQWIISVRQPLPTLKSLWRWGGGKTMPFRSPGRALTYYEERLDELAALAPQLRTGFVLLRPDRIVKHTDETLEALGRELGLTNPLSREYAVDETTGDPANGDFSRYIRKGRIVANRRHGVRPELTPEEIEQAREAHRRCMDLLSPIAKVVI